MKMLAALIGLFCTITSKANTFHSQTDTIDFWHVFYNNELIKQYDNHNSYQVLTLKIDSIKVGDSITVRYFRDTPCGECNVYLIIECSYTSQALIARGTYTFCPLTLSVTDLKKIQKENKKELLDVYYLEDYNNYKISLFKIKLE